jgi:dTDP-4-amino-4,6-dideoxygalactose transaminase
MLKQAGTPVVKTTNAIINVTEPFLPPYEQYEKYIKEIWERKWLTNHGPLVQELEQKLKAYLGVEYLAYCANGTVVLQIGLKALGITGEVITTPFSYVATTSAILWEGCMPVFVDINNTDFNIDVSKIEAAITPRTEAILATHVYGNPCDVEAIEGIAGKHGLKVIYDGAHAFGTLYKGRSLLSYGDISTCSFHATKLFHTIEGGAIICNDPALSEKIILHRQFGHVRDDHFAIGINGKNSEFHAAMGLCNLPRMEVIMDVRKRLSLLYDKWLHDTIQKPVGLAGTTYNYGYYPVALRSESQLKRVECALNAANIFPRRYFYTSLNTLDYLKHKQSCPVAEDISVRMLSLPLYFSLLPDDIKKISEIINAAL